MLRETLIGITLLVLLLVLVAVSLARLHTDVNNLMTSTSHLIDRSPAWRNGKPRPQSSEHTQKITTWEIPK